MIYIISDVTSFSIQANDRVEVEWLYDLLPKIGVDLPPVRAVEAFMRGDYQRLINWVFNPPRGLEGRGLKVSATPFTASLEINLIVASRGLEFDFLSQDKLLTFMSAKKLSRSMTIRALRALGANVSVKYSTLDLHERLQDDSMLKLEPMQASYLADVLTVG